MCIRDRKSTVPALTSEPSRKGRATMTPDTWERTCTVRYACTAPVSSTGSATGAGVTVTTVTSVGGIAGGAFCFPQAARKTVRTGRTGETGRIERTERMEIHSEIDQPQDQT